MKLHERIYQLRRQKNMTQQDLADRLGVSRQAVSRWEMGTAKPEIDSLTEMSRIFGITVDELLTGEQADAAEVSIVEEKTKPSPRKWIIAWAVTWLAVVVVFAVLTFVRWKFAGGLMAIAPVTLIVQIVNLGFELGIVFVIGYFIRKAWMK